ncbi:MAG: hypothetical protein Q9160_006154 [Pyrenula sp. 1 TL-2023]
MRIPRDSIQLLVRRDSGGGSNRTAFIAIITALGAFVVVLAVSYYLLRRIRRQNYNPKYVPGSYLKRKWQSWVPRSRSKYGYISSRNGHSRGASEASYTPTPNAGATEDTVAEAAAAAGVDRNTSVRSVMTLPPYSYVPHQTEEVIGREGERGGMDVVVEYPETGEEEETRREDQMESLYQIRQARRQEVAEREDRRQARRDARARGDHQRLEELRRESRIRADNNNNGTALSTQLLAEHQSRGRERRVSEVAYASVGHVRHDGTRLRANSNDSERGGLLADAAPMGERRSSSHHRNPSNTSNISSGSANQTNLHTTHHHNRSTSSLSLITTSSSNLPGEPTPPSTHRSSDPEAPNSNESSSPSDSADIAGVGMPEPMPNSAGTEPPNYDALDWGDAPPYSSPARNRESAPTLERQLAERARLAAAAGDRDSAASLERIIAERSRAAATRKAISNELQNQGQRQSWGQGSTQQQQDAQRQSQRTSRSSGVMRVPTLAPQLPALDTLPSISVEGATEPNTPVVSPAIPRAENDI